MWGLDSISGGRANTQGQVLKFQLPSPELKLFDLGPKLVVAAGPQIPFIVVKALKEDNSASMKEPFGDEATEKYYQLPNEARGVEQLKLLRDKYLLAYLSEGIFYLVDLDQKTQNEYKLKIALEIRVPGA